MANLQATVSATLEVQLAGKLSSFIAEAYLVEAEAYDEAQHHYEEVANGAVDQAVNFGPLTTCQALLLVASETVSVKFNGSATGLAGKVFMLSGAGITSLTVSNASGSMAYLRLAMAGT